VFFRDNIDAVLTALATTMIAVGAYIAKKN